MDLPVNQFKRALRDGRTLFGAWLMSGAPSTAEALGVRRLRLSRRRHGAHAARDATDDRHCCAPIAGTPASAVVRMPWNDMVMVKRALDAGAQTVLMPFVQNAEEAKRAVAYTRYPPRRRPRRRRNAPRQPLGTVPNYLQNGACRRAVRDRADRDAGRARAACRRSPRCPASTRSSSGPRDLSASMGHLGDIGNADVQETLQRCRASCAGSSASPVGIIGANPELVAKFVDYGFNWIAIGSDMAFMVEPRAGMARQGARASRRRSCSEQARRAAMHRRVSLRPRHQGEASANARSGRRATQALYWVDINAPSLNRFDPATGRNTAMPMPESIGCFALRARRRLRRRAARRHLARAQPTARSTASIAAAPYDPAHHRFNDGRCDPAGPLLRGHDERKARRQHARR